MAKYYFDTSIIRDYYEDRKDKFQPLGEWAFMLLSFIRARGNILLISDFLEIELETFYSKEEIKSIFEPFKNMIEKVIFTKKQHDEARKISSTRGLPKGDALHAIIARDNGAILVTRDHHFEELQDITQSKKPEELI